MIKTFELTFYMKKESLIDITSEVSKKVEESEINVGIVHLFAVGSTSALSTIEFEPGLKKDIMESLNIIAPKEKEYEHNKRWHDNNGRSHVRATILGSSLTIPIRNRSVHTGTWQQIVLFNLDIIDRERVVLGTIIGD